MSKIRGIYSYDDKKKMSKKDKKKLKLKQKNKEIKKLKKNDKKLRIMCNCNHLDARSGKAVFKKIKDDDGKVIAYQCKICKGIIYRDKTLFTKPALESAWNTFYSLFAIIRRNYAMSQEMHKDITNALFVCKRAITIAEKMEDEERNIKKNKKKNKNGKKNKKNKNYTKHRINY